MGKPEVAMMGSHTSSSSDNLSEILGIKPEFTQYLSGLIRGMCLESKTIMESAHPSGKVTISLTYSTGKFGKRREIPQKGGKTGNSHFSSTNKKKHKPPSRRKRDQARFRAFVEKKKQIKLEKRKTELSRDINKHTSFQCPPPQEETITVAESPTVPINSVESTSKPQFTSAQLEPQKESSNIPVVVDSVQSQPGSPSTVYSRKGIIQIVTGGNFSIFRGTGGRALRGAGEICHWGEGGNFIPSVRGGRGGVGVEKILPSQTEYYIFPLSGLYFECSPQ